MTNANEAAAKGAAFLDEYFQGWRGIVQSDLLDMARNDLCVGAQLSGTADFWDWAATVRSLLFLPKVDDFTAWAEEHGFYVRDTGDYYAESAAYQQLTLAWQDILAV